MHRMEERCGAGLVQRRCSETGCPSPVYSAGKEPGLRVVGPRAEEGGVTLSSLPRVCTVDTDCKVQPHPCERKTLEMVRQLAGQAPCRRGSQGTKAVLAALCPFSRFVHKVWGQSLRAGPGRGWPSAHGLQGERLSGALAVECVTGIGGDLGGRQGQSSGDPGRGTATQCQSLLDTPPRSPGPGSQPF